MKKVLLYSGGLDSYIISKLWKPDVKLFFNYGIEQNEQEIIRLPADVVKVNLNLKDYMLQDGHNTIPLRNLLFSTLAVNYGDIIAIGGLKSDLHFDKKPEFAELATNLFNWVLSREREHRNVKVVIPFAEYTKAELVYEYLRKGGTIEDLDKNSWSCHTPDDGKPCGRCQACKARQKAINDALKMMDDVLH